MAPGAREYLSAALNLMEEHSVRRAAIDWPKLRAMAFVYGRGARTPADTYPAIRLTLLSLDDDHSALIPPPVPSQGGPPPPIPTGRLLDNGRVGYASLPGMLETETAKDLQRYTDVAQHVLRPAVCGWVLDLRADNGGDLWPMLAGITPLLTHGTIGYFVAPDQSREPWRVTTGKAYDGAYLEASASDPVASRTPLPVAVLTGPRTGSAGEAVTIAFRGQTKARSFGAATAGTPSANRSFHLSDGATLVITDMYEADRTGHVYGLTTRIVPDQQTSSSDKDRSDPTPTADLTAALAWLTDQPECRAH